MRGTGPNRPDRTARRAWIAPLSRDNKKDGRRFAPLEALIFFIFVAVSVRLATVATSIIWKKVLGWPK